MTTPYRRIYVASSWRNENQPMMVNLLRAVPTFEVYDFRNPSDGDTGFAWSDIDPDWLNWTPGQYVEYLHHPLAEAGYRNDFKAMQWADTFVLVLPCGRSAHLELGWAVGQERDTFILTDKDGFEPELMYKMVTGISTSPFHLLGLLGVED